MRKLSALPYFFVLLAFLFCVDGFGQSQVIISQYIETNSGSTPKGIEIFNVSGSDIDFAIDNLVIKQGTNGGSCNPIVVSELSGTLLKDEVWVLGTADLVTYTNSNGTNLSGTTPFTFLFSGNDALVVELGGIVQDMFGDCGDDPGSSWSGSGVDTKNHNLQIKDGICDGDTNGWTDPSDRFDEIANGSTMTGFGNAPLSCSNTRVSFDGSTLNISESGISIELCIEILNASADTATTVDLALLGSGLPHVGTFATTTLTFPAGSSDEQCVTIPIINDTICANSGSYTFVLQAAAGPEDAVIINPDTLILTVTDDDGTNGTIVKQGFEEDATETFTYTSTNGVVSSLNSGTPGGQRIRSGSKSFQSRNVTSTLNFVGQDISAFTNVELVIWNSSISGTTGNGADAADFIKVYVSETPSFSTTPNITLNGNNNARYGMNGTVVVNAVAPNTVNSSPTSGGTLNSSESPSKLVISIPDAWNNLYTKIVLLNNNNDEIWCIDDIRLNGINCNACVDPTISSINPISGPKETVVNIIGTNFITGGALTDVQFGGISASSFNVLSDAELTAVVPADAITGVVKVLRSSCNDISSETFTFLEEDCETGAASLIISELCDSDDNYETDRYIEIYNPSDVSINLNGWTLYSLSNASNINDQSGFSWTLSGTIAAGEAMTCGNTAPVNGGPHTFSNSDWNATSDLGGSYNWNGQRQDGAALYNGTTLVDAVLINPGGATSLYKDRVLLRNSDVCESNPDSPLSEWTVSDKTSAGSGASTPRLHSSCVLLTGADPSVISDVTPNIAVPICDGIDITVTAGSGSLISYQWYYNDGSSTWTEITDDALFSGSTTETLNITSVLGMDNYQFYCKLITDLACINYTRAIQLDVLDNDKIFFRSKANGLWSDPETWEFSSDWSNYSDACIYPTKANSELIEVESGYTVTFDLQNTDTLPSVWILSGGILQTQSSRNLIIDDVDPTAELIVEGTYIDNGTTGSSIEFLNGATWELSSGGTIIKTNTSSSSQYRDHYENGISTIPADGNWIYRRLGNNDLSVAAANMYYPNLSFENHFGVTNYSSTNSFYIFSGSSGTIIYGDLKIGIDGTGTYTARSTNTDPEPIMVMGDLYIGAGSSFLNVAGSNIGTGIEVQGDMDIEGTLDLSAGTGSNQGILKLSGDDMIGIGANTIEVNHLIVDKNPGFAIYADMSVDVKSELSLTSGIFELAELTNTIILPQGVVVNGGSNASHIDGFVSKSGSEDFLFPVGDEGYYQPIGVETMSEASTFRARYVAAVHPEVGPYYDGNAGAYGILEELGHCDYWTLNRIAGSASANVRLTYGNNPCNDVQDATYLNMAKWDGSSWEYPVIGVNQLTPGEIFSTNPFPNFSDFVLTSAGPDNLNVLPIQLTSFTAKPENQKVKTAWTTESESNNDYFTLERSADARLFQEIGKVNGAGTSHHTNHYTFTDQKPLPGVSYYRLKQTDFDEHYSYSDIKAVTFTETEGFSLDLTYRDGNDLNLVYNSISPYILVEIFDVLGKRVFTEVAENYGGRSVLNPNLGRGAYVVRISSGNKTDSGKVVW